MILKAHRFHGYNSLNFVYRRGQTVRDPLLALRYIENKQQSTWRMAVVVSRKVSKSAVVRNRIRRRIYEIVRHHQDDIAGAYDLVLLVYSAQLSELDQSKLTDLVVSLLTRAQVISAVSSDSQQPSHDIVDPKGQ